MWKKGWFEFEPPRERMFGKGDLKFVILDLIRERPSHGYDLIRSLENRFRGFYSASPGTIYPILQLLEDMGHVTSVQQEGRKVYTITEEGRRFITERRELVDGIWQRAGGDSHGHLHGELHDLFGELHQFGKLMAHELKRGGLTPQKLKAIREILRESRKAIEAILESS